MINEATAANLRRKAPFVDRVQIHNGVPLWSWLELSLTELCNRACVFCPRVDADLYPNQALHMPMSLVEKIDAELDRLGYVGTVVLCGYGEPLLHPDIVDVVGTLSREGQRRLEIVTNGDRLTTGMAIDLIFAGAHTIVVSLYDGPHQVEPMRQTLLGAGLVEGEGFILRDRWHTAADAFGLKLTNRAGTVTVGDQDPVEVARPCHYMAYELMLDWNGDALLCPQDWQKRVKLGNASHQSLLDIWTGSQANKHRARLMAGRRNIAPCNSCNTDGTLHGFNHVTFWNSVDMAAQRRKAP